jgi:hypothetical protein
MKVVATAPMPGSKTPSLPLGAAIFVGFSMNSLNFQLVDLRRGRQYVAEAATQTNHNEGSREDMQTKTEKITREDFLGMTVCA